MWLFKNNILNESQIPLCKTCNNKPVIYNRVTNKVSLYCSNKCTIKSDEVQAKTKDTCNKKYHFIYETTNIINNKKYIGVHSTDDLNDGYIGSVTLLIKAINKYGKESFNIIILNFYNTRKDALIAEKAIVNIDIVNNKMYYNLKVGGEGGSVVGRKISQKTKDKISKSQIGKQKHDGFSLNCSLGQTGRKASTETKSKMSQSKLGDKNHAYGKPSHKRNNEIWDRINEIEFIWLSYNKPGYYALRTILINKGFPEYNYQKILLKIKSKYI